MSDASADQNTAYCRDCGATINRRAEICPECGIRQRPPETDTPTVSPPTTTEKDPGLAAVASAVVPGLGQIYNGQIVKGIALGIVVFLSAITIVGLVIAIPLWIYLVFDAYRTAQSINTTSSPSSSNPAPGSLDPDTNLAMERVVPAVEWVGEEKNNDTASEVAHILRSRSPKGLSPRQLEFAIEAIDAYQDAHDDVNFQRQRAYLVSLWEEKTDADWEVTHSQNL